MSRVRSMTRSLAVGHQQSQLSDEFAIRGQWCQVSAHPGLVGDDSGVTGIGFALSAVTSGGPVDHVTRDGQHRLILSE